VKALHRIGASTLAIALPLAARAQSAAPAIGFRDDSGELGALMLRSILAMIFIVVVAVAVLLVMRRYGIVPGARRGTGSLQVVETLRLAPRATLFVVDFGGRRLLLGHAEHGLTVIARDSRKDATP
jgi:hypothetical protein